VQYRRHLGGTGKSATSLGPVPSAAFPEKALVGALLICQAGGRKPSLATLFQKRPRRARGQRSCCRPKNSWLSLAGHHLEVVLTMLTIVHGGRRGLSVGETRELRCRWRSLSASALRPRSGYPHPVPTPSSSPLSAPLGALGIRAQTPPCRHAAGRSGSGDAWVNPCPIRPCWPPLSSSPAAAGTTRPIGEDSASGWPSRATRRSSSSSSSSPPPSSSPSRAPPIPPGAGFHPAPQREARRARSSRHIVTAGGRHESAHRPFPFRFFPARGAFRMQRPPVRLIDAHHPVPSSIRL
jgi:hypothetical protein